MIRVFESRYKKAKSFYKKYERWVTPTAFSIGFVWDNITLQAVDFWFQNVIFIVYLFMGATVITLINAYGAEKVRGKVFDKIAVFLPIAMQFIFGGLFSAFFVFYSRSTSLIANWPFLLFLGALFVGNEFFKKGYQRLTFQLSIFFIALFSYSAFAVPMVVGSIGDFVFILSGIVALFAVLAVVFIISKVIPGKIARARNGLILGIGSVYAIFNIFYFTNLIPPIPLSVTDSAVLHSLESFRSGEYIYRVSYEPAPQYLFYKKVSDTVHLVPGRPLYIYTAIFAPTKINTTIYHKWSYMDPSGEKWISTTRIPYSISGGRDQGYRGFSIKYNLFPGKWRVDVENERGQLLKRKTFTIVDAAVTPKLETSFR